MNNNQPQNNQEQPNFSQRSFKEQRIREITIVYYSQPEVKKILFDFSQNRETIPRYYEGFGKRPDALQYEGDILEHVKKGTTSFHCSEELWSDPLEISTEMSKQELDELRIGWDLLIDIDSPYLEYSKIYAQLLIETLEFHNIKNYGIKFSVTGDTDILIKNKEKIELIPIKNAIKLIKNGENLEVLSLDNNKKLKLSRIYDYLEHEDTIYDIFHSQSKIPIKVTGHHSVYVWDKGNIIQKKVTEIRKGDLLISYNCNKNPFVKDKKTINFEYEFSKNQFSKKVIKDKIELTSGLMRLIGYFLAEGHTTKIINQTGFSFNINEKAYIEDVINLLTKITKRKISIRHPNPGSTQILIHSKKWHDFFKKFCGEKKEKHIPEFSWNLSKELFSEMLKGYIRGDGYKIGEYGIVIKSVSKRLIKEFVWLCKLNNISCSLFSEKNKPHKLPQGNIFPGSFVYILKIPKSELDPMEFHRTRNKFSPYPRDKIFPTDGLRYVYKKIKPGMFNCHRPEQMTLRKKRANLKRIKKVLNWFREFKTTEEDEECRKILEEYDSLFYSDISIVEVRRIVKKEKEKVYDVSVEGTESFFGNDYPVLLHNSGSKGFHIIIPWKAFPIEIYNQKTKNMFPEWPRIICQYLAEIIKPKLADKIFQEQSLKELAARTEKKEEDLIIDECISCKRPATKKYQVTWICPTCKNIGELIKIEQNKRIPKCPNDDCRKPLIEKSRKEILFCEYCNFNTLKNPDMFQKSQEKTESLIEADLILVAPRHLFRMPYSLHEKTALSSIVLDKEQLKTFQITDAKPFKTKPVSFYPNAQENEAKDLLLQALDWYEQKTQKENIVDEKRQEQGSDLLQRDKSKKQGGYKKVEIPNPSEEIFPPQIQLILQGIKQDGRKRALGILIPFFKSLGVPDNDIEKKVFEWNEKNFQPLKKGYILSQLNWSRRNPDRMPYNFDNPIYKDLGVDKPDQLAMQTKNPVSYAVKKYFMMMKK